jgi:hypothetical protein
MEGIMAWQAATEHKHDEPSTTIGQFATTIGKL